jgi:hypothetical protein
MQLVLEYSHTQGIGTPKVTAMEVGFAVVATGASRVVADQYQ